MKLEEAYKIFRSIQWEIEKMEDRWGNLPDEFELNDYKNSDERFKHSIARGIVDRLSEVQNLLKHIQKPIKFEGPLLKNSVDRYEVEEVELTSGATLEYWDTEFDEWVLSRIEHNGSDYYIVDLGREEPIEGVRARIRR